MTVIVRASFTSPLNGLEMPPELSRQLRRSDDFIRLAVVAAHNLVTKLQGENSQSPEQQIAVDGIVLGTSYGTMQTNFEVLDSVVSGQQTSPTLFSHSVFNSAAGYIGSIFAIQGQPLTLTDFSFPFFRALREGSLAIHSGRMESCLILQVETYSDLLQDGRSLLGAPTIENPFRREHGSEPTSWQPGVVAWLLQRGEDLNGNSVHGPTLGDVKIIDTPTVGNMYLGFEEKVTIKTSVKKAMPPEEHWVSDPLGSPQILNTVLAEKSDGVAIEIEGPWGTVEMSLG